MDYGVHKRRPKKTRDPRGLPVPRITERDLLVFALLQEYRFLRTNFLHRLIEARTGAAHNYVAFRARLALLRHHAYLKLPRQQFQYDNYLYTNDIYELEPKGAAELKKAGLYDHEIGDVRHGERKHGIRSLAHALQICDIIADLEIGAAQHRHVRFMPPREVYRKMNGRLSMRATARHNGQCKTLEVTPDAVAGLENTGHGTKAYRALLIEAHQNTEPYLRSTLDQKSHLREVLAYRDIGERGAYKQAGLPNMLVLFVTVSKRVQDGLMAASADVTKGKGLPTILYKHMPKLGTIPPPTPTGDLLNTHWDRVGFGPINLAEAA